MTAPRVAAVAPHAPFLDTLARRWLDRSGVDVSAGLILLPTRRAARALAEAFLRVRGGAATLLPRITALGAIDEASLALAGALDLLPAIEQARRLAALASLVLKLPEAEGGVRLADRAWALARELAALMDEAERSEVPLEQALARACGQSYAEHWEITLRFLRIVTEAWPAWLAEQGLANPAARQRALLDAQAAAWAAAPPGDAVWAAGMTGATPAVARLLRVVAGLPRGQVILPWFDATLEGERLDATHPQAALHTLLAGIGARGPEVENWETPSAAPAARAALLAEALLPAHLLGRWRDAPAAGPDGLTRLAAADQQEEAAGITLVLRQALERPGRRAALVTPDRGLAARVSAELLRWGVVADDSAGEKLAETPPALFLRLLARAAAEGLAPVPLLALLKHPLAAAGLAPAACRRAARALELAVLRGPRPPPGFTGLRRVLAALHCPNSVAEDLVERLRAALAPVLRLTPPASYAPRALLTALLEAAEALTTTDAAPGADRLWQGEEGEALAVLLAEALAAWELLPEQPASVLPGLLDALLEEEVVRTRRALRGRDDAAEHPRVSIWGLLEARLQAVDVVVLGGLCEGVWPPATDPGPWMSRPMRDAAGLPSAEERVGQAAHDFVAIACAAPVAVLSAPMRRDGAPAVPARWLARLDARLGAGLPLHPAATWARALDQPAGGFGKPCQPPHPRPALAQRPRRFTVTDIETLIADPYAVYARRILNLRRLDPLEQETDALDYGRLVHRGIQLFLERHARDWPADPAAALREAMHRALLEAPLRAAVAAWWAPRLARIADWIAATDQARRAAAMPVQIEAEQPGQWQLDSFTLTARADRIERRSDGSLAILDYKTGKPPDRRAVHDGTAPQLLLEAAMAQAGAFDGVPAGPVRELAYWYLRGGHEAGRVEAPLKDAQELADLIADTPGHVRDLLAGFDDPARPYPHRPHPGRRARGDYAQLARAAELAGAADE